jgi:hypothetical protein
MRNYYDVVREILVENERARDDDMYLYSVFCAKYLLVKPDESFYSVMCTWKVRGLPSYESLSRARRKVQEKEPSLSGKEKHIRQKEEEEYREYYRNH